MRKNREITVIGPLSPLRGGIPKHTKNLFFAFKNLEGIKVLSPKKLYPEFLYPGKSQIDKALPKILDKDVAYLSKVRIALRLSFQKFSGPAVIVWWTPALALWTVIWSLILRMKRVKVVFLCHNIEPHEKNYLGTLVSRIVLRLGAGHIVQSDQEKFALENLGIQSQTIKLAHPVEKKSSVSHIDVKTRKTGFTFLSIGIIRGYKNVPFLIRAFGQILDEDLRLRIVGEIWSKSLSEEISRLAALDKRVTLISDYVSDDVFSEEIKGADCIVLPYATVTGSGVLADALSWNKQIITSDAEGFAQYAKQNPQINTFKTNSLEDLVKALEASRVVGKKENTSSNLEGLSWESYAKSVSRFLDRFQ